MTGAGLLVTLTQGWFEKSSHHMVFLMLLSAPGLLVLMTQSAKRWHGETA